MSNSKERRGLPLFRSPLFDDNTRRPHANTDSLGTKQHEHITENNAAVEHGDDGQQRGPHFRHRTETSNAELFYDLFFVANLTVFTAAHEINDHTALLSYTGFFAILWFTWFQVGLYDVRFAVDSLFERTAKAAQFGVMVGLAVTGPRFDSNEDEDTKQADVLADRRGERAASRALTLILMVSRLVIVCQYLQTLWLIRRWRDTRLPMLLNAFTYLVAALIYLGVFWNFDGKSNDTAVVWYIVAVAETISITTIASIWQTISFKGTHLVERMSLLTLIILGEGVIGLAERSQKLVESEVLRISDPSNVADILCGILILYFLYMLYFDNLSDERGAVRQQLWAFLHFPLHLALVLAVEGISQAITWRAAVVSATSISHKLQDNISHARTDNDTWSVVRSVWHERATFLNDTVYEVLRAGVTNAQSWQETEYVITTATESVRTGVQAVMQGATNPEKAVDASNLVLQVARIIIFQVAGFSPPTSDEDGGSTSEPASNEAFQSAKEELKDIWTIFGLTYIYLFVSMGFVLLLYTIIEAFGHRNQPRAHKFGFVASGALALGLCLLATMIVTENGVLFLFSPWILPTIMLTLLLAVILTSIRIVL